MSSNNIIVFPKANKNLNIKQNEEEMLSKINSNIVDLQNDYINQAITFIIPMIFNHLEYLGLVEKANAKDNIMLVESLRSLLMRNYDMLHPIQDIADQLIEIKNEFEWELNDITLLVDDLE